MNLFIRNATTEDIPQLSSLISVSVRSLSRDYYTERQIEAALANIFGIDTQLIVDETYYLAEIAGQIAGCGGWSKRKTLFGGDQAKEDEDVLLDPKTEPARIRAFFVHPDWARKGIGARILQACEAAALQMGFKYLELVATLPGEPFYRAFGYQAVKRIEIPLPGDLALPAVLMRKLIHL